MSFQLSYRRARIRRQFTGDTITGEPIDNAYGPGMSVGGWYDSEWPSETSPRPATEDDYIRKYVRMAIAESLHETLEWLRVDGQPWLDPHSTSKAQAVVDVIHDFIDRLEQVRNGGPTPLRQPTALGISGQAVETSALHISPTDGRT